MVRADVELYYRTENYNLTETVQKAIETMRNNSDLYVPGRRPIFSGQNAHISTHPKDNILPPGAPCKHGNFSIWWDHAAEVTRQYHETWLKAYKAAGGEYDEIVLDVEEGMDIFSVYLNPGPTPECISARFQAIERDSRFPEVLKLMEAAGFITPNDTSSPGWLEKAMQVNVTNGFNNNSLAWDYVQTARAAAYSNASFWEASQNAGNKEAHLNDYGFGQTVPEYCAPGLNGFLECVAPNAELDKLGPMVVGDSQANEYYGWFHNYSGPYFPGMTHAVIKIAETRGMPGGQSGSNLGADYEYLWTPFNSLRQNILNARMHVLAAPHFRFKPWVAYRSFAGDAAPNPTANTDYYQEILMHLGLMPNDGFLYFNPCEKPQEPKLCPVSPQDNDITSATLVELSAVAGCSKSSRRWLAENNGLLDWLQSYLLTGTNTPEGTVWRFTPDLSAVGAHSSPSQYATKQGKDLLLTVFNPQDSNSTATITIPDGEVWTPSTTSSSSSFPAAAAIELPESVRSRPGPAAPLDASLASSVSSAGLWITQPKGAAQATRFRTVPQPFLWQEQEEL